MKTKLNPYLKWGGMILVFLFCLYGAWSISMGNAPDEEMRYQVPYFIFEKGYLPFGNEIEIRNGIWGFSYAYTPYLPSIIAVGFMRIFSLFTMSQDILFFSSRLVSVISVAITWLMCCKIGERIFRNQITILLLAVLVCFLPQFIFLGSYLNNDAFAVMVSGFIIYLWIKGDQENWKYSDCVLLGISLGLCALTYFNAYGFILCSIIFCLTSVIKKKMSMKEIMIRVGIVFFSAFIVAGWFFIRNMILHNGDFLGMKTMYADGEMYALDIYKPTQRSTPKNLNYGFSKTFLESTFSSLNWFTSSWFSFIGCFGYMVYSLPLIEYILYTVLIVLGFISGFIILCVTPNNKMNRISRNLFINLCLSIFIPVILSMYYSWATDYQPQGRYIISCLIPLMIIVTYGYDKLFNRLIRKWNLNWIILLIIIGYLLLFNYAYWVQLIPNCHDSINYTTPNMLNIIKMYR